MIVKILFTSFFVYTFAFCYAEEIDESVKPLFTVDFGEVKASQPQFANVLLNDSGCIVWTDQSEILDGYDGRVAVHDCYYTDKELQCDKIYLSRVITDALLSLGFPPLSSKTLDRSTDIKTWGDECFANYACLVRHMDDCGNVFLTFHCDDRNSPSNYSRKLGVWNKNRGFKYLEVSGINDVIRLHFIPDHILVYGFDIENNIGKLVVLSAVNGFWNEKKQIDNDLAVEESIPIETAEVEKPKQPSWWEQHKPKWW